MYGRYGQDELSLALLVAGIVLNLLAVLPHAQALGFVSIVLIAAALYRCFSRNIYRRRQEREQYLKIMERPRKFWRIQYRRFRERKTYVYYRCKQCGTYNRIPRGHGRILITCPKCHNQFQKGKGKSR